MSHTTPILLCAVLLGCTVAPDYRSAQFLCEHEVECPGRQACVEGVCGGTAAGPTQSSASVPVGCGNGNVDSGEECDADGESASCNFDCTLATCGDGILNVSAGENCDGGLNNSDSWSALGQCNGSCTGVSPYCGDGVHDPSNEECDDGNLVAGDSCNENCQIEARWYQANRANCVTFCNEAGLSSVPSPEGHRCTSGEVIPSSALDAGISYDEGCWPSCNAHSPGPNAQSSGERCYASGQESDGDPTDFTMGCYCG